MGGLVNEHVPEYAGELYGIYIMPQYHRSGIGRKFMQSVTDELVQTGVPSMYIWVLKENTRARRFYESPGGQFLLECTIALGDAAVAEVGYGWLTLESVKTREHGLEVMKVEDFATSSSRYSCEYFGFRLYGIRRKGLVRSESIDCRASQTRTSSRGCGAVHRYQHV